MNNQTFLSSLAIAACVVALSGCSDPSDKVPKSGATEPQKPAAVTSEGLEYIIRSGSKIEFVGSKVTGSHSGGFTNFSGTLRVKDGKVVGLPEIKINMKSTWSDSDRLTGHLKSPDFFDVEKFPISTFVATSIDGDGAGQKVAGNFTLHGVTKGISFPAAIQAGSDSVTVKAEFAINRKDFGIVYPGKPDDLIRDNVVIKLDLKATPGDARPEDQVALKL
jgi:polyisoprenoid-binding protein YceI